MTDENILKMDERNKLSHLPKGWVWAQLGDIVDVVEKTDPHTAPETEFDYLDIASIDNTQQKITSPKNYLGKDAPSRARQVVKSGDILFSTVRTYLKNIASVPSIYDGQIATTGFCVIRPSDGINKTLVFLLTQTDSFLNPLNELQRGTSYPAVRDSDVFAQFVPLPPLPEQHRIVAKIEELFSDLDAGVAALRKIQTQLKRYRQAVLKATVEGKLTAEWRAAQGDHKGRPNIEPASALLERIRAERAVGAVPRARPARGVNGGLGGDHKGAPLRASDAAELPALPEGWLYCFLADVAEVHLGRQRSPKRAVGPNMRRYLRAANVTWNGLALSDVKEMDFSPTEFEIYRLKRGDVLLSEASGSIGEVGKPAVWNEQIPNCCFQNTLIRVRSCAPLPSYLYIHFLFDALAERFRKIAKGVGIHHLGAENMSNWIVSIPPLAEQQQIVVEVERRLSVTDAVERTVNASLKQAERLRQSILKRAFAGKLVPQDPSDEPAERLLERIRAARVGAIPRGRPVPIPKLTRRTQKGQAQGVAPTKHARHRT